MCSGVAWSELEGGQSDVKRLRQVLASRRPGSVLALACSLPRAHPQGAIFNYSTVQSCVLSAVLAAATGRPLADYCAETIWGPAGMEANGYWALDAEGGLELGGTVVAIVLLLLPTSVFAQEKRIALLIGNKDYKAGVGSLTNPLNDIRIVGDALRSVGFEVLKPVENAHRSQMLIAIHAFAAKLKAAGPDAVGFLYYSGHGIASAGENYLIPTDVDEPSTVLLSVQPMPSNTGVVCRVLGIAVAEVVAHLK
jgi:CubicO group peptidase (beta-lactamase class C family)